MQACNLLKDASRCFLAGALHKGRESPASLVHYDRCPILRACFTSLVSREFSQSVIPVPGTFPWTSRCAQVRRNMSSRGLVMEVAGGLRNAVSSSSGNSSEESLRVEHAAQAIAREAGALILQASGKAKQVEVKSVRYDLVTEVDRASEALIKQRVQEAFPEHRIVGEETCTSADLEQLGSDGSWTWIVDPIDGTLNFVGGMPLSVVSFGVARGNQMEVGVVYNPFTDEMFSARRGHGAILNGEKIAVMAPDTELEDCIAAVGYPSKVEVRKKMLGGITAIAPHVRTVRALGSAALHISYVAAGRLGFFFELNLKPWDIAAAWLILEEAGGRVTDMAGRKLSLQAGPVFASNGGAPIHDRALGLLREARCTGTELDDEQTVV